MIEENLTSLSYDGFKSRLTTEVPHLEKMGSFLRSIILEDDAEVDLSSSYFIIIIIIIILIIKCFNFQMLVREGEKYHDKGLRK
jgi:hypothetical protein